MRSVPMTQSASATARSPRLWMDVTTSLRNAGQHANGTLRIERGLARGLQSVGGDKLAFCRYVTAERRFVAAHFDPAPIIVDPQSSSRIPSVGTVRSDTVGRRFERKLRLMLRGIVRSLRERFQGPKDAAALFPQAHRGDVLLLGGETWSDRYDFSILGRLSREAGIKVVAICQDLIPQTHPQFFASEGFVARHNAYVDWLVSDVDLVMVYSKAVQSDLRAQALARGRKIPPIAVVPLGADIEKAAPRAPQIDPPLEPDGFVIAVSTIQSRKNFDLLYRLWNRFAEEGRRELPKLVIVGARGFGSNDLLHQIAHDPLVRDSIVILHNAGDAELAWLYENCRFTLYPSFAEGWGLPIVESLAYGKPCLASNTTSMPEAGSELAVHLDPLDFKTWHDSIIEWSHNKPLREAMGKRIKASYRPVTWADSAAKLANQLQEFFPDFARRPSSASR